MIFSFILSMVSTVVIAQADTVAQVKFGAGWVNLPYCGGKTRIVCSGGADQLPAGRCDVEFSGSRCNSLNLYTASNFYPGIWTLKDLNVGGNAKFDIDYRRLHGIEKPYFYAFFRSSRSGDYIKIRYSFD